MIDKNLFPRETQLAVLEKLADGEWRSLIELSESMDIKTNASVVRLLFAMGEAGYIKRDGMRRPGKRAITPAGREYLERLRLTT